MKKDSKKSRKLQREKAERLALEREKKRQERATKKKKIALAE